MAYTRRTPVGGSSTSKVGQVLVLKTLINWKVAQPLRRKREENRWETVYIDEKGNEVMKVTIFPARLNRTIKRRIKKERNEQWEITGGSNLTL